MVAVVEDELSMDPLVAAVEAEQGEAAGAVVTFLGVVRRQSRGQIVEYLEYQAYAPMAELQLSRVAAEVREQWGAACAMMHRVGRLEVGEASLAVAVAAPHRKEAFEACAYAVNRVKAVVPVWKKEVARDGSWWVEDPLETKVVPNEAG